MARWLVLPMSAHDCMVLYFAEPFIITRLSSWYEPASVAQLDERPTAGSTPAGLAKFFHGD